MSTDQTTETDKPGTPDGYTPFRIDTSAPPVDAERITLFWIDDVAHTGPKQITGALALQALDITRRRGPAAGAWHCVVEAVGEESVEALLACKQLSYEQAKDFLTQISAMYYGQAMDLVGK